jgi:four helix bundle protein
VHNYKKLVVWQRAYRLGLELVRATRLFEPPMRFTLGDQISRAAISVPSNIAEGSSRGTTKEFKRFLGIALGSACELETQIMLARDLNLVPKEAASHHLRELVEIQRMLHSLRSRSEG